MSAKTRKERMARIERQLNFEDLPDSKTYNGKRFLKSVEQYSTKEAAQKSAKNVRNIGFNARVVKGKGRGLYALYVNPKITKRKGDIERRKTVKARKKSARKASATRRVRKRKYR